MVGHKCPVGVIEPYCAVPCVSLDGMDVADEVAGVGRELAQLYLDQLRETDFGEVGREECHA